MKWVFDNYLGKQVYYKEELIKEIYKEASKYLCSNCETDSKCKEHKSRCGYKIIIDLIDKKGEGKMEKYELLVGETRFTIPKENLKLLAMQKAIDLKRFVPIKNDNDAIDFLSRIGIVVSECKENEVKA